MYSRYARLGPILLGVALIIWSGGSTTAAQAARIGAGDYYSLAIARNGSLWAWGYDNHGQLGVGTIAGYELHSPKQAGTDRDWVTVSAGRAHALALKADGSLWGWGYNTYYQLFGGPPGDKFSPTHMGTEYNDWVAVAAGGDHSLGLRADGSLWSSGANSFGQCGLGYPSEKIVGPAQVGTDTNWAAIAAGAGTSLAIKTDGSLWSWGNNSSAQLGLGTSDTSPHPTPAQVLIEGGANYDWMAISVGFNHCLGLKADGTLWGWGINQQGQLGVGEPLTARLVPTQATTVTGLKTVSAGAWFSLGLKPDGSLWAWGANVYGQLGFGDTTRRTIPTQVGTATNWQEVAAASYFSLALRKNLSVWAWGWNNHGQLGLGNTADKYVPVPVPGFSPSLSGLEMLLLE